MHHYLAAQQIIHPSAWNKISQKFAFWAFSEVRMYRILGESLPAGNAYAQDNPPYVGDIPKHTSLVACLLVKAGRGLEPRPVAGGYSGA